MSLTSLPAELKIQIAKSCDLKSLSNLRSTSRDSYALNSTKYLNERVEDAVVRPHTKEDGMILLRAQAQGFWSCCKCYKVLPQRAFPARVIRDSGQRLYIAQYYLPRVSTRSFKQRRCLECRLRGVLSIKTKLLKRNISRTKCMICLNVLDRADVYMPVSLFTENWTRFWKKQHWSCSLCRICFDQLDGMGNTIPCGKRWMEFVEKARNEHSVDELGAP